MTWDRHHRITEDNAKNWCISAPMEDIAKIWESPQWQILLSLTRAPIMNKKLHRNELAICICHQLMVTPGLLLRIIAEIVMATLKFIRTYYIAQLQVQWTNMIRQNIPSQWKGYSRGLKSWVTNYNSSPSPPTPIIANLLIPPPMMELTRSNFD